MKRKVYPLILASIFNSGILVASEMASGEVVTTPIVKEESVFYINSNGVRVRGAPGINGKVLGELSLNDRIKVVNPEIVYEEKFVEVVIVKTYDPIASSEKYYLNKDFLSPTIVDYKDFTGKYFVVVNVASEMLRVYERVCADNSCPSKMLMETEVVVGEDKNLAKEEKGKGRSILGSYRVTGWSKFYQDPEGHYPAWYRDGYPNLPRPQSSWRDWFANKIMPLDKDGKRSGSMRGAFGWYTAFVAPEPFGQWTHGTLGWGADKDTFIKKVKKPVINVISDPRSSGCTRNNNEAIAFIRSVIDVGAPIIKIYAKEALLDPSYSNYPLPSETWNYVLTKTRSHLVERSAVLKNFEVAEQDLLAFWQAKLSGGGLILDPKSPLNQIIEVGTYERDTRPDAVEYVPGEKLSKIGRKIGLKGNVYGIKSKDMFGVFYVDAGLLEDYMHPAAVLEVSGFLDEVTPSWMAISNIRK